MKTSSGLNFTPKFLGCGSKFGVSPPFLCRGVVADIFFSTPLQWECHFFTKTSRTAGTVPVFEPSKLRLWLQRRAFWAQTGAVAAVWCPLSWASTRPPSIRRLFGPSIGPNFGHTEKWREEERSGEKEERKGGEKGERERHG